MSWWSRLGNVFRQQRLQRELDEELRFHVEARIDDAVARGVPRAEAEREAWRRLGAPLRHREASRDVKLLPWLDSVVRDARLGVRVLIKQPVVTAAAVLSLSLAMGACVAAFSLIDALILRPLPARDPARLVWLTADGIQTAGPGEPPPREEFFSYPAYERLRDAAAPLARLFIASSATSGTVTFDAASSGQAPDPSELLEMQYVGGDLFAQLGLEPQLGRLIAPADDVTVGAHPVVVISDQLWTRRFARDPRIVGRQFTFRETRFEIIGVGPRGFSGLEPGVRTDMWLPLRMRSAQIFLTPMWDWLRLMGRLAPGVTAEQVHARLEPAMRAFRAEHAAEAFRDAPARMREAYVAGALHVESGANGPSQLRRQFAQPLWLLALVAGLVLLMAGANIAALLVARAASREREMALRVALGGGGARLVQQMMIESGLVALAACVLGALLAHEVAPWLPRLLSASDSLVHLDLRFDLRVAAFLALLGVAAACLFGLAPARRALRAAPGDGLKAAGHRQSARLGLLRPLIGAQAGFCVLVLFLAGLFLATFANLARIDPGFDPQQLALIDLRQRAPESPGVSRQAWARVGETVRTLPEVRDAAFASWGPLSGIVMNAAVQIPGRASVSEPSNFVGVTPGYFATMRIRFVDGRDFTPRDSASEATTAIIVNEAFARRYFPGQRALGQIFFRPNNGQAGPPQQIVGVVGDAKYETIRETAPPTMYLPWQAGEQAVLLVRTRGDVVGLTAVLSRELARAHPAFRVTGARQQAALVADTMVRERLLAGLAGFFALVAMLLAIVGLYGVLSYGVSQRTREFGIRMALGAQRGSVARLLVRDLLPMLTIGIAAGIGAGLLLSRFIVSLLYGVRPGDAWSLALPVAVLLAASVLAASGPARRAARVDPIVALQAD